MNKGDSVTLVEPGLDWVAGDKIYVAPTNNHPRHNDYLTVADYLPETGRLTTTEPFEFYHFGAYYSTGDDYNGVDMRAEVILLNRNVKVVGNDANDWGCATVTSDRIEADRSVRTGRTIFDNVEFYKCGQADTFNSAIRFEGAKRSTISKVN